MADFTQDELKLLNSALDNLNLEYKQATVETEAALVNRTSEFPEQARDRLNWYAEQRSRINLLRTKVWRMEESARTETAA